eukprot:1193854-Prorocentrum_minimum.AAC.1
MPRLSIVQVGAEWLFDTLHLGSSGLLQRNDGTSATNNADDRFRNFQMLRMTLQVIYYRFVGGRLGVDQPPSNAECHGTGATNNLQVCNTCDLHGGGLHLGIRLDGGWATLGRAGGSGELVGGVGHALRLLLLGVGASVVVLLGGHTIGLGPHAAPHGEVNGMDHHGHGNDHEAHELQALGRGVLGGLEEEHLGDGGAGVAARAHEAGHHPEGALTDERHHTVAGALGGLHEGGEADARK